MSVENKTFTFIVSWGLWLVLLSAFSKTRLGYVLLYYSLVLMILFVLVTEFKQLGPYLTGIGSIGDLNKNIASKAATADPKAVQVATPTSGVTK